ncbi:hypothetical protein DJ73_18310 [Halorubrum sp. Ea1]|nr:hypothetical protein DJ74_16310 [Halorubrum sp. Ea8]OYR49162.1 hypothetical protein DJ73_18310 [Halorubrum sp. Ea1]
MTLRGPTESKSVRLPALDDRFEAETTGASSGQERPAPVRVGSDRRRFGSEAIGADSGRERPTPTRRGSVL